MKTDHERERDHALSIPIDFIHAYTHTHLHTSIFIYEICNYIYNKRIASTRSRSATTTNKVTESLDLKQSFD